jgi:hypothetical protein
MIDTEKYQPTRQNMKFVTRSLRSLANKLHILARQADIFGINQFTSREHIHILYTYILNKARLYIHIMLKKKHENQISQTHQRECHHESPTLRIPNLVISTPVSLYD